MPCRRPLALARRAGVISPRPPTTFAVTFPRPRASAQLSQAPRLLLTLRGLLEAEVRPILRKLRTDIERIFRSSKRRTTHAERRHTSGERPTGDAMNDVAHASVDQFFHDTRRNTVVVLGGRGRAHIFSTAGQHVTSLRLDPGELRRKTDRQRWTPLDPAAAMELRERLTAIPGA